MALLVAWLASGCRPALDTTHTPTNDTFGQIVYYVGCQHLAFQLNPTDVEGNTYRAMCHGMAPPPPGTPAPLTTLDAHRMPVEAGIDLAVPAIRLQDLQGMLVGLLPLYDDGTMETMTHGAGAALTEMAADAAFTGALSHFEGRLGYRPQSAQYGLLRTVMEDPQLGSFNEHAISFLSGAGHAALDELVPAVSAELLGAVAGDPTDSERTLLLARNFFFSQDSAIGTGTARPLVIRDERGIAEVAPDLMTGGLPAPFVDTDGDGLADVDAFGRFVDATGKPLDLSPFPQASGAGSMGGTIMRDSLGRALSPSGGTLFQYVDLDQSVLAAALRDGPALADPTKDIAFQTLAGATALLGARVPATATIGGQMLSYQGFDVNNSALLDIAYAFTQFLGDQHAMDTLELARTMMGSYESDTSRVIKALLDAKTLANADTTASIPVTSDLYDEMVPYLIQILETPGLVTALVNAMPDWDGSGKTVGLATATAQYMTNNDHYAFDPTPCGSPPKVCNYASYDKDGPDFSSPVDRTQPDTPTNRSIFERMLWLIHDANGVRYCSRAGGTLKDPYLGITLQTFTNACEGMEIDDLAVFFMKGIAGRAKMMCGESSSDHTCPINTNNFNLAAKAGLLLWSDPLEQLTTIAGLDSPGGAETPTPQALARVLLLDPAPAFVSNLMDPAVCSDGDRFIDVHADVLPALEKTIGRNNFYTDMAPVAQAFYDSGGGDAGLKILVNLLSLLHEHWPSAMAGDFQSTNPFGHGYATLDGAETYEPLAAQILTGDLVPALVAATPDLINLSLRSGNDGVTALHNFANYMFDPRYSPGLTYRNGATTTVESDGVTPVSPISPYYVLADAYAEKRRAIQAGGATANDWVNGTSSAIDTFLAVDGSSGSYSFHDRNFVHLLLNLIPFVEGRLAEHEILGDVNVWVSTTLPQDLQTLLTGPVFAALGDFAVALEGDPAARGDMYAFMKYVSDEASSDEAFRETLTAVADLLQVFLDDADMLPLAHDIGQAIAPGSGLVDAMVRVVARGAANDPNHVTAFILSRLWSEITPGETPIADISTAVGETNRATPGTGGLYAPADFQSVLSMLGDFLVNDDHGLQRFIDIVKQRNAP